MAVCGWRRVVKKGCPGPPEVAKAKCCEWQKIDDNQQLATRRSCSENNENAF